MKINGILNLTNNLWSGVHVCELEWHTS